MTVRPPSLRGRMLWLMLPTLMLAWTAAAVATYFDAHQEVDALLDAHLRQSARLLAAQAELDFDEIDVEDDEGSGDRYGTEVAFQVRRSDGGMLVRSANAPPAPLARAARGFSEATNGGRTWRVYTLSTDHGAIVVHFAEDHAARERIARHLALRALAPMLVALPVLGLLIWWVTGRSLRPLASVGEEVARRGADDLSPVSGSVAVPPELQPMVRRLDDLLGRLRESLDSERRFTSHAAHELRTPVAALRAQAEVAATSPDLGVRAAALAHCVEACDRMTRLVSQLLLLARADESGVVQAARPCRLDEIVRTVLAELAPDALQSNVEVSLDAPRDEAVVVGDAALLAALVRNLVDNAVRHGGHEVRVSVRTEAHSVALDVADDGPGVPEHALPQLGRRFYRAPEARGAGSGLGLSIVARIAQLHRATMACANGADGRGFQVRVAFPR
jgi:two-component system, OmpR family, sensor histidine kinase QseC